jgi:hypothetical protein
MRMRFEDPACDEPMLRQEREHAIDGIGRGASGGGIELEHRIDDDGLAAVPIERDVTERRSRRVIKALDLGHHGRLPCTLDQDDLN